MYAFLKNNMALRPHIEKAEQKIAPIFKKIEESAFINQQRVLDSFRNNKISDSHFHGTTGYGYDDFGRDALEAVYSEVFGGEAALVRPQLISGTHAITTVLFGLLRPGDDCLFITGKPYDTLHEIVGWRGNSHSSLRAFNIDTRIVELNNGKIDVPEVLKSMNDNTKLIAIQRSCGYDTRPSLTVAEIGKAISAIRDVVPEVLVFVDNCYGEFVEEQEPIQVGADIMAGSLIKNPGGGLAKFGGYIVGTSDTVGLCAERLTAPGLGSEVGPTGHQLADMYQGFFLSPHTVSQALKGALFTSALMESLGFQTTPHWSEPRTDLIQSVTFNDPDKMIAFCQAIQAASPVNAHVKPYASDMPGYADPMIMAAGTFVQGGSLELSADGPVRPPYIAFVQGGLTYEHVKAAVLRAVDSIITI